MSIFFNSAYKGLEPYIPGEQPQDKQYVKLNTNESPFPPAPGVIAAVNDKEARDLRLYSDPELNPLKRQLAETFAVDSKNVFIGNGSDECLNYAFMAFGEDGFAFPDITYSFYKVIANLNQIKVDIKPLKKDFTINVEDYLGERDAEGTRPGIGKGVVIANPNAPTGIALKSGEIARICETNADHVVIVDEAYVDFAKEGTSAVELTKIYGNLLVIQTFSKSRSMAGARVGFAIGSEAIIRDLETLRNSSNPYNVSRISMKCAVEALKDKDYFNINCDRIRNNRRYTKETLEMMGFRILDSQANFLLVESDRISGPDLYRKLKDSGVLVRHFNDPRIANFNRITIGSKVEMDILIEKIRDIQKL